MNNFVLAFDNPANPSSGGDGGSDWPMATEAEALAGTSNTVVMSPLRVDQAIDQAIAESSAELTAIAGYESRAHVAAATISTDVNYITVLGYNERGDHPPTRFIRDFTDPNTPPVGHLAWVRDAGGNYWINDEDHINVRTLGAKGDTKISLQASMTAGSPLLTVPDAGFTVRDIGKYVHVREAGPDKLYGDIMADEHIITTYFMSTIVGINSPSVAVCAASATHNAVGVKAAWGADDTTALINAGRAGSVLGRGTYVPPGNYIVTDSITGLTGWNDYHLFGDGPESCIIAGTDTTPSGASLQVILLVGAYVPRTTLIEGEEILSNYVNVVSLAGIGQSELVDDRYIVIQDLSQPQYANTTGNTVISYNVGEVNRVKEAEVYEESPGVFENRLVLASVLQENYNGLLTVGQQTKVDEFVAIRNPHIHDIAFDHLSPITIGQCATINCNRVAGLKAYNITIKNPNSNGIAVAYLIDSEIHDIHFVNSWPPWGDGHDGKTDYYGTYCITITRGSYNVWVSNIQARRMRHLIKMYGDPTSVAMRNVTISRCTAIECPGQNFTTQDGQINVTFENCHAIGPGGDLLYDDEGVLYEGPTYAGIGFYISADRSKVINCSVTGMSCGVYFAYSDHMKLSGFTSRNCRVGLVLHNATNTIVENVTHYDPLTCGTRVFHSSNWPSLLNLTLDNVKVVGNPTEPYIGFDAFESTIPCGFQFGFIAVDDTTFTDQWEDLYVLRNCHADDADVPFRGGPISSIHKAFRAPVGVKAEKYDRTFIETAGTATLASGRLYMGAITLEKGVLVEKLGAIFATAPVGQTNLWYALYTRGRILLGTTVDALTTAPTADAMHSLDMVTKVHAPYDGLYYIGVCQVAGTVSTMRGRTGAVATFNALPPVLNGTSNTGLTGISSAPTTASAIAGFQVSAYLVVM